MALRPEHSADKITLNDDVVSVPKTPTILARGLDIDNARLAPARKGLAPDIHIRREHSRRAMAVLSENLRADTKAMSLLPELDRL